MFDVEKYISEEIKDPKYDILSLDKLVIKIDIKKILYKFYDDDIKMIKLKEEVSNLTYINLFSIFLNSGDYKLINSAFKLNDLLLHKKIIDVTRHTQNIEILRKKLKL